MRKSVDINKLPLTLSSRPSLVDIRILAKDHDIFVTLLEDSEYPDEIGQAVKELGRQWWHCPISLLMMRQSKHEFKLLLITIEEICQALIDKKRVFIHCEAGIDRTGTVALATLICLGFKKRQAVKYLISKRPEARNRLHLDYVDRLVESISIKSNRLKNSGII
jgi:protein tyrosine/serine phosphatase